MNSPLPRPPAFPWSLRQLIERELAPGEQIVWSGMPIPRFFTGNSTAAFLFAIPWTAFAVFWMVEASGATSGCGQGRDYFHLFGLPFVLIGLGLLGSPLWTYRKALKTAYVITDRRAITFEGGRSTTIRSYPPDRLHAVYRKERRNGTGDVILHREIRRDSEGGPHTEELGFLQVPNPREIEQLLQALAGQDP
jgi:hypothetical protein